MKKVIIVRHAKSVQYGYDNDFYRDLTERGKDDAARISKRLNGLGLIPDLVIASPATRTMHTATIFCKNLGYAPTEIRQEEILYQGLTTQDFINMLHDLPETIHNVFVFGHNPTVYYLAYNLVKYFNSDMPTCSTVALDFPVEKWKDISARGGQVAFQITPKTI